MATLLRQQGLLPNTELIWFLTRHELEKLMEKPDGKSKDQINKTALLQKCMRRMKMYPSWHSYRFNELYTGIPKPNNIEENVDWSNRGSVRVVGTPVSEGIVTARACVIHDFSEVDKIQAGDILITHSTDIGWSPYFPILGGVVTELGGLISHGLCRLLN